MKTILITISLVIGFMVGISITQIDSADLGAECPPQIITAKSIRANTLDYSGQRFEGMTKIILPNMGNIEIKIGEDTYTSDQLKTIKK